MRTARIRASKLVNALLALLLGYSSCSLGEERFTIGVQDFFDYSPYSQYRDGEYTGFNRELLDMFADRKGFAFDYRVRPIKRLYMEYFSAKFDFKYPDNPLWQPDLKGNIEISYSAPLVQYIDGLMLLPDNRTLSFTELKSISLLDGFSPPKIYLQREKEGTLKIIRTATYERLLELVLKKRVEAGYFNTAIARGYLVRTGRGADALVFAQQMPYVQDQRALSSIQHPEIIEAFNRFLQENKGAVELLKKEYGIIDKDGI